MHVEEVRVGRDVAEAKGVDRAQRGVEALVQAGERGVGAGREEEGVRLGGEGDGEGDLGGGGAEDCAGEGEEGCQLHCCGRVCSAGWRASSFSGRLNDDVWKWRMYVATGVLWLRCSG